MIHGERVVFYQPGERVDPYSGDTVLDDWTNPEPVLTRDRKSVV